jgi:divalent metal cation (Fe/Co/Zn/Cd) transporter
VVLAGSVLVLPVLGYLKLRLAKQLRSRALRGDGVLSAAGAALAAVALAGTAMNESMGWWQADPATAALIALFLAREGGRTLR